MLSVSIVLSKHLRSCNYSYSNSITYYHTILYILYYRENITLAAHMKLSRKMTWREKFERVEQVIEVVCKLLNQLQILLIMHNTI